MTDGTKEPTKRQKITKLSRDIIRATRAIGPDLGAIKEAVTNTGSAAFEATTQGERCAVVKTGIEVLRSQLQILEDDNDRVAHMIAERQDLIDSGK